MPTHERTEYTDAALSARIFLPIDAPAYHGLSVETLIERHGDDPDAMRAVYDDLSARIEAQSVTLDEHDVRHAADPALIEWSARRWAYRTRRWLAYARRYRSRVLQHRTHMRNVRLTTVSTPVSMKTVKEVTGGSPEERLHREAVRVEAIKRHQAVLQGASDVLARALTLFDEGGAPDPATLERLRVSVRQYKREKGLCLAGRDLFPPQVIDEILALETPRSC